MEQFKNDFIYEESDDPCICDDQYILKYNKNIYIQVSDKYIVQKWVEKDQSSYLKGEFNCLNKAFKKAIDVHVFVI